MSLDFLQLQTEPVLPPPLQVLFVLFATQGPHGLKSLQCPSSWRSPCDGFPSQHPSNPALGQPNSASITIMPFTQVDPPLLPVTSPQSLLCSLVQATRSLLVPSGISPPGSGPHIAPSPPLAAYIGLHQVGSRSSSAGTHPCFLQAQDTVRISLILFIWQMRKPSTETATQSPSLSC